MLEFCSNLLPENLDLSHLNDFNALPRDNIRKLLLYALPSLLTFRYTFIYITGLRHLSNSSIAFSLLFSI